MRSSIIAQTRLVLFAALLVAACSDSTDPSTGPGREVVSLKAGVYSTCALSRAGVLRCWGRAFAPPLTGAFDSLPRPLPGGLTLTDFDIANGIFGEAVCAVAVDHATYCWGLYAAWDQYFDYAAFPARVDDTLSLDRLSVGDGHACGLAPDGAAYCWGSFVAGKRGGGTPVPYLPSTGWANTVPNRVAGGLDFVALGASRVHTCGLTTSQTIYCWGLGSRLGDTASTLYTTLQDCLLSYAFSCAWTPIPVRGLGKVQSLAVGEFASCVVVEGGGVWCWQGDPYTQALGFPAIVSLPETATAITVGSWHACALGTSGTVYCWGGAGPWLGAGGTGMAPVAVETGLRFKSISAGAFHTCGLDRSGVAFCWGENSHGELGDGSTQTSTHPVRVHFE